MADDRAVPKSLIEQIYDEFVKRLEGKEGFDADLVEKIRELSRSGELKSHPKMQKALKP
jgi:hypothetical protein